jgi:hypothetical protein
MTRGRSDPGESNPPRSQAAGHAGGSGVRGGEESYRSGREWYRSGIGVESEEWKEVGEWSDKESRCSRSGMYLVGVYGMINMMCGDSRVQGVCAVRE